MDPCFLEPPPSTLGLTVLWAGLSLTCKRPGLPPHSQGGTSVRGRGGEVGKNGAGFPQQHRPFSSTRHGAYEPAQPQAPRPASQRLPSSAAPVSPGGQGLVAAQEGGPHLPPVVEPTSRPSREAGSRRSPPLWRACASSFVTWGRCPPTLRFSFHQGAGAGSTRPGGRLTGTAGMLGSGSSWAEVGLTWVPLRSQACACRCPSIPTKTQTHHINCKALCTCHCVGGIAPQTGSSHRWP